MTQQAATKPIVIIGPSGIGKTLLAEVYWKKRKFDFDIGWKKLGVNHPDYEGILSWLDVVNEKLNASS
jgi:Holliday junction resolvasome RuvABC ATP-dependent DNA helicase subunit